jgi:hypothetical protein
MALIKTIQHESGAVSSYHKIKSVFFVNGDWLEVQVSHYFDESHRRLGKPAVVADSGVRLSFDDWSACLSGNIIEGLYAILKEKGGYEGAEDALVNIE